MRLGYSGFAGICQVIGSLQTGKGYLKMKPHNLKLLINSSQRIYFH
ncbi:hypothetical protein EIKCOROL_02093 [Eikenella corrodens ATCC 23834]|uniref:Uncharacterized protein n=1 Tax=Eikenella corrodens ATCC 23834 TaxID=546274 RepID=C0DXI4_EIKCO|nr:hypothetical protein EIKCOROL_02093 [Eikenella corrodens ATCC 23834]